MCFSLYENENTRERVMQEKRVVYKVVKCRYKDGKKIFLSAVHRPAVSYEIGKKHTLLEIDLERKVLPSGKGFYWVTRHGFYSWDDLKYAEKELRVTRCFFKDVCIIKCVIPEGAKYHQAHLTRTVKDWVRSSDGKYVTGTFDTEVFCSDQIIPVAWYDARKKEWRTGR